MPALESLYPGDPFVAWLILVTSAITLVSAIAVLASRCLRRRAALRHSVLFAALLCTLATPVLAAALMHSQFSLIGLPLLSTPKPEMPATKAPQANSRIAAALPAPAD